MELDEAWQRAFDLAWQSFCGGTTPVGAVVLDDDGQIVAQGQNRRFQTDAAARQLSHCHIAHAEINALALLPPERPYSGYTLVTTLDPCCMCAGAIVQSTIRQVHFAGRDPYGGAARMAIDTPQARRRPRTVTGPLPGRHGWFAELLHVRWLLEHGASAPVLDEQRRGLPAVCAAAASQRARDLFTRLKDERASADEALSAAAELWPD